MALVSKLTLSNVRNFPHKTIELCSSINVITGQNAAGKTTILEALYLLAHGKSFRTSVLDKVINRHADLMTIYAEVGEQNDINQEHSRCGFQKSREQKARYQLNQEPIKSVKLLTEQLPLQLITTESTRFFTDGPKLRRDFLAWGLFYTNSDYYALWKQYQRVLAQRNRALKQNLAMQDIAIWDEGFIQTATQIDLLYQQYIQQFTPLFNDIIQSFLPELDLSLHYSKGWDEQLDLSEALQQTLNKAYALGYTPVGIHRADFQLICDHKEAQDVLSRGQLKLASYALSLTQGLLLKQLTGKVPIYLIDDLAAELDATRQKLVFDRLNKLNSQILVTSIEPIQVIDQFNDYRIFPL